MFSCQLCDHCSYSQQRLLTHIKLYHAQEPNFKLKCELCSRTFTVLSSYRSHKARSHCSRKEFFVTLCCPNCDYVTSNFSKLLTHYGEHINVGTIMECPFSNCSKRYSVYSSLSAHVSRCHKDQSTYKPNILKRNNNDLHSLVEKSFVDNSTSSVSCMEVTKENSTNNDRPALERYYGLMLLKFQTKYNLPSSVVQSIIGDIENFADLHEENIIENLYLKLLEKNKLNDISYADFLELSTNDFSTIKQLFDTEHKRYRYYKKEFSFVQPQTINLGLNKYNKQSNFQYVPLTLNLMQLLKHEDVFHPNIIFLY